MTFSSFEKTRYFSLEISASLSSCLKSTIHHSKWTLRALAPPFCFLYMPACCAIWSVDDSDIWLGFWLAKVWRPGDIGVGRCRWALRGHSGPTVAWQQPVGKAVGTPLKVILVRPCSHQTSSLNTVLINRCVMLPFFFCFKRTYIVIAKENLWYFSLLFVFKTFFHSFDFTAVFLGHVFPVHEHKLVFILFCVVSLNFLDF